MAVCQPLNAYLAHCNRGQAPSHMFNILLL